MGFRELVSTWPLSHYEQGRNEVRGQIVTYVEKLKLPEWQQKRLEVLKEADWKCQNGRCQGKTPTLHVHHLYYRKGSAPWEYENHEYKVLCEGCHDAWHAEMEPIIHNLVSTIGARDLSPDSVSALSLMIMAFHFSHKRLEVSSDTLYTTLHDALYLGDTDQIFSGIISLLKTQIVDGKMRQDAVELERENAE